MTITTNKPLVSPRAIWCTTSNICFGFRIRISANTLGVIAKAPFSFEGERNGVYNPVPSYSQVEIGALQGVLVKEFLGSVTVIDNDPPLTIEVTKRIKASKGYHS
jgi:hypothetical protein